MVYVVALLVLCVLIFVHELGHFLVAKICNVGVLSFSIGFGPVLWKKRIGETTYSFRLFPLGGFVRMAGDDPRCLEDDYDPLAEDDKGGLEHIELSDLSEEQISLLNKKERWFFAQGFWAKFFIVLAGPAFNILFAYFVAVSSIYIYGQAEPIDKPIIGEVVPNHPAEKAGIKRGDYVRRIDGKEIASWQEFAETVRGSGGREMLFDIVRKDPNTGKETLIVIKIRAEPNNAGLVTEEERAKGDIYRIGVSPDFVYVDADFDDAVIGGFKHIWFIAYQTLSGIYGLVSGHISMSSIAGPVGIFREAGRSARRGLNYLLGFMVFLSISLAILNLLPIPVLDGGHILFFVIELVKGSPISIRMREVSNQVGLALLLGLMIFAVGNDLLR